LAGCFNPGSQFALTRPSPDGHPPPEGEGC
jgi:hypothetical protein